MPNQSQIKNPKPETQSQIEIKKRRSKTVWICTPFHLYLKPQVLNHAESPVSQISWYVQCFCVLDDVDSKKSWCLAHSDTSRNFVVCATYVFWGFAMLSYHALTCL